jgi:hypothetical protein
MDCRPTDRLAALGAIGLGPCHAHHHALADDRALKLSEDTEHLKHRLAAGVVVDGTLRAEAGKLDLNPESIYELTRSGPSAACSGPGVRNTILPLHPGALATIARRHR